MRRLTPSLVGIATALVHVTLVLRAALGHSHGEFSYAVDDAYIHLALAKHLAFDGVYGVTAHAFSAASSSVIWPFLLAGAMRLFGDHVVLPLAMNLAAAVALVVVIAGALEREAPSLHPILRSVLVAAIVLLVPVATLAVVGMEHLLHAALTLAFVFAAARVVADAKEERAMLLVPLAAALVGTRYEGAFPVGIAAVLLALRGRVGLAASVAAAGAAPIVLFGVYSMAHGATFFPSSVLLKRRHLKLDDLGDFGDVFGGDVLNTLALQSYLLPLAVGTSALLAAELWRRRAWSRNAVRLILAIGTTVAHLELASLGWFFRYEAYLVALDVTVIALAFAPALSAFSLRAAWRDSRLALVAGGGALAAATAPLWVRALAAQGATPMACTNIHDQQIQTARFLARYFAHDRVAVNDIGAVAYFGGEPLVDLEGLATLAVAEAKSFRLDKPLDAAQLASFAKGVPVAVVYDEWFPRIPTGWVRLGRLRIGGNVVCASNTVSIYATSGAGVPRVLEALRAFGPSLPDDVRREGRWIETPPQDPAQWRADTGDLLSIDVAGKPDVTSVSLVDAAGSLWLPKIGEVRVRGLSLAEIPEAVRSTAARHDAPLPADAQVRAVLADERPCHVLVSGSVARPIDPFVDCGTPAASVLARAGWRRSEAIDPYVWRSEGGALRRVELAVDEKGAASGLLGGDIVIVE